MLRNLYFRAFQHRLMWTISCLAMLLVAGCSGSPTRIQTWDGSVENADQVAVLEAPSEVKVSQVNGQRMSSFLIDDLALDYELLPGVNRVVFTYKTIWAKTGVVENGESKVHVIKTEPQSLLIDAKPGETYRFEIDTPESRAEAEAYATDFSVSVVDGAGTLVASSVPWEPEKATLAARSPIPDTSAESVPRSEDGVSTLEQMKALWGGATEEEKREFLRWAFE